MAVTARRNASTGGHVGATDSGRTQTGPSISSSVAVGKLEPRPELKFEDVWRTLSAENEPTAMLTSEGASEVAEKAQLPLRMTPARHLLVAAFGTDDRAVTQVQSNLYLQSVKPATRAGYGRDIATFLRWCDEIGLPVHFRFPIAANILAVYLYRDVSTVRAGTVKKRQNGLLFWHRVQRMPWAWTKADANALRKSAKLECLPPLEKRRPVRLEDLQAIARGCDRKDPAQVAVWAAAALAFWAMCRPGELTVRSNAAPRADRARWLHLIEHPPTGPKALISFGLQLPSDKTHGTAGFDRIAGAQPRMPDICPVNAIRAHLAANALGDGELAAHVGAFSYRAKDGSRRELTESFFRDKTNSWLAAAGLEVITGHCFRIGGASLFVGAGLSLADIKLRGGWESDTYLVYIRENYIRHATMFGDLDPNGLRYQAVASAEGPAPAGLTGVVNTEMPPELPDTGSRPVNTTATEASVSGRRLRPRSSGAAPQTHAGGVPSSGSNGPAGAALVGAAQARAA